METDFHDSLPTLTGYSKVSVIASEAGSSSYKASPSLIRVGDVPNPYTTSPPTGDASAYGAVPLVGEGAKKMRVLCSIVGVDHTVPR
jgi:hypothetical protein